MNEKEIQEYIRKQTENITAPDSLDPHQIEKQLEQREQRTAKPFPRRHRMVAVACCFLLVFGTVLAGRFFLQTNDSDEAGIAVAEKEETASADQLSYEEAYESICSYYEAQTDSELNGSGSGIVYEAEEDTEMVAPSTKKDSYTDTDVQVEGVMEGDIVKTDGHYLYSLHDETTGYGVTIYSVKGKEVKKVSNIAVENSSSGEIYLEGDRLILIGTPWESDSADEGWTSTQIDIYDVSHPASPKKLRTQNQSGSYSTSRVVDGYLYTFTKYRVASDPDQEDPKTYIPQINGKNVPEDSVRCIEKGSHNTYIVMTSLAIDGSKDYTDTLSTLGGADVFYVSSSHIYATDTTYQWSGILNFNYSSEPMTKIAKYHFEKGKFTYQKARKIRGTIADSYCMHEQDGNLCLVYNRDLNSGLTNGLCVLDEDLNLLGEIGNLGRDESIYASYFMDNTAYFVTYQETDPVFAVDLSDPSHPKLKSELKLPGYSDYLHSFGNNQLIGIGIDEDDAVKMSVFSIGKNKKLTETSRKALTSYISAMSSLDRHSVLVDEEWQLIGFPASNRDSDETDYLLYSYNQETGKFKQMLKQKNVTTNTRGIRIGGYFYVVDDEKGVTSYSFPTCGTPGTLEE